MGKNPAQSTGGRIQIIPPHQNQRLTEEKKPSHHRPLPSPEGQKEFRIRHGIFPSPFSFLDKI
jgi:hypothetical protein